MRRQHLKLTIMLVISEREADFCPYIMCSRTCPCIDIRTYRPDLLSPWRFRIKRPGGRITSIPLNPFTPKGPSILETSSNRVVDAPHPRRTEESLSYYRPPKYEAHTRTEFCIVDVIRRCNQGRKISNVRRKLDGVALRNRGHIVPHRRSRSAIVIQVYALRCKEETRYLGMVELGRIWRFAWDQSSLRNFAFVNYVNC